MTDAASEKLWHEEQQEYGWVMPRAPWWKRTLIVRRIRAAWHTMRAEQHAAAWGSVGIGIGGVNQYDRWVLYGIATGKERPLSAPAKEPPHDTK